MWLIDDAWFYWTHRLLHHPKVFRYVHAVHHKSVDVNPFTSLSFHLLEPLIVTFWIVPFVLIVPVPLPALMILQLVGLFNNIKSHLGYELYPQFFQRTWLRYLVTSTHHSVHHTRFRGNYGLHFRFWDLICGTELPEYNQTLLQVHARRSQLAG